MISTVSDLTIQDQGCKILVLNAQVNVFSWKKLPCISVLHLFPWVQQSIVKAIVGFTSVFTVTSKILRAPELLECVRFIRKNSISFTSYRVHCPFYAFLLIL